MPLLVSTKMCVVGCLHFVFMDTILHVYGTCYRVCVLCKCITILL